MYNISLHNTAQLTIQHESPLTSFNKYFYNKSKYIKLYMLYANYTDTYKCTFE